MSKYQQFSSVVSRPNGYGLRKDQFGIDGSVVTEWGFVKAWSDSKNSSVSIIIKGVCHTRTFRRSFTQRGLITKAVEFAREVAKEGL